MSYTSEVLADSPIVYYRLGESSGTTMADSSGNSRDGAYVNSPNLSQTGLVDDSNTAAQFVAGSSDYATSVNDSSVQLTNAMIEVLIKQPSNDVLMRDATSSNGWFISTSGSSIQIRIGGTTYTTTVNRSVLQDGLDHHVVWGADASTVYLYIDGTLSWSTTRTPTGSDSVAPWYLAKNGLTSQYAGATFDEWAIYSSLSGARIAVHAAAASSTLIDAPAATATASAPTAGMGQAINADTATATADAPSATAAIVTGIDAPAATATVAAPVPDVLNGHRFAAYDLDDNSSQALNVPVELYAVLTQHVLPEAPPTGLTEASVRVRRLSLVMPTPTLDSRKRPA